MSSLGLMISVYGRELFVSKSVEVYQWLGYILYLVVVVGLYAQVACLKKESAELISMGFNGISLTI